jgi:hypothetical protein
VGLGVLNRIGKVINHNFDKFIELISETRKGYNQKAWQYNPSGEDSPPVKNDRIILLHIDGTGKYIAHGVLIESQGANPGEKIFFARDQEGKIVSKITMLNDGLILIDTNTETTGEASGNYQRTIKGKTTITEKDNREYFNEKSVTETIKENKSLIIEGNESLEVSGDKTTNIGGDENRGIDGDKTENVGGDSAESVTGKKVISISGDYMLEVSGNVIIKAGGNVKINGMVVNLN